MNYQVKLPQNAWFGDKEREIDFPRDWKVNVYGVPADEVAPLNADQLQEVISNPTGSLPISQAARGKKEIAIIIDDITRPTPIADLVPFVLEELKEAGVPDKSIRFIVALGAHGAHNRMDFEKKLGSEVIRRFPVYNHNPYENNTKVGTTSRGTEVAINSEVAACDFKIALGSILPHPFNGFGGGGKIILPGVSSIDSIHTNHMLAGINLLGKGLNPVDGLGRFKDNESRQDVEEAARLAGLDFIVNAMVNTRRQIVALVAGHHVDAHHEGVEQAYKLYAADKAENMDVVVTNAYAKSSEAAISILFSAPCLKEEGGDIVLVVDSPLGQVTHYLLSSFGKNIGGRLWNPRGYLSDRVKRIIVLTDYPDYAGGQWFGPPELLHWASSWEEVMKVLNKDNKSGTKVAVYVDGTMQYFAGNS